MTKRSKGSEAGPPPAAASSTPASGKPWGGRFTAPTDQRVEAFTASVATDRRLAACDLEGSMAHVRMLGHVGLLTHAETRCIVEGLQAVGEDLAAGRLAWSDALEDVHMNIEHALIERIGDVGRKLHTGRSRNDQVATDMRLYLRGSLDALAREMGVLQRTLLDIAAREASTIMPGFTHLQVAQPVTLGHHLLAWFEMLLRDMERFAQCRARVNVMPLGAAALAGTSLPIDREFTARELGFTRPAENSLDAVSDRDFVIEFVAHAALAMTHLSRIAEELVLWASDAYRFIDIDDAFCTGSSIMPQKKNPDVAELIRGKTGRVNGNLVNMLTLMKGQPLAYNRDNQEDKQPLFDTVETLEACVGVLAAMLPAVTFDRGRMRSAAVRGYATATDLAEYLVARGVPFRTAHEIVGRTVRHCMDRGCDLAELSLEELRGFDERIDEDVFSRLDVDGSVAARGHVGGTAPVAVSAAVARGRQRLRQLAPAEDGS